MIIRNLLLGYCYGMRSERKLCQEVAVDVAHWWFCKLDPDDKIPLARSMFSENWAAASARAIC